MDNFSSFWIHYLNQRKSNLAKNLYLATLFIYGIAWVPTLILEDFRYIGAGSLLMALICLGYDLFILRKSPEYSHLYWRGAAYTKLISLIIKRQLKAEKLRVFATENPKTEDQPIVDLVDEEVYQKRMSVYVSEEIPDHPFEKYWDVFVLKHQNSFNIFLHVLTMYIFWGIVVAMIVMGKLWPALFIVPSMILGNMAHRTHENTYIDPHDAIGGWKAFIGLNKIMYFWSIGRYGVELKKRQDALAEYLDSKVSQNFTTA